MITELILLIPTATTLSILKKEKSIIRSPIARPVALYRLQKRYSDDKLKLGAILRADKNDYFDVLFNPRFSVVYSPVLKHNFRASFQSGYRYPILFEAYSNVNSGGVKRVGGLPVMSNGIFENAWLQTSITSFQSAVLKDINTGMAKNAAIEKNKGLLKKNPYTYIEPEHVNSLEAGYKGLFAKGRIFAEADVYISRYRSFIAQANMNVPKTDIADSIPYYLYERSKQSPYRMWTNSQTIIDNYGFSLGTDRSFSQRLYCESQFNLYQTP